MQTKHIGELIRDDMTTLQVVFKDALIRTGPAPTRTAGAINIQRQEPTAGDYTYKVLKADLFSDSNPNGIAPGSLVVVPSKGDGQNEGKFLVGQVTEVHLSPQIDPDSPIDYRWVVSRVDTSRYAATLEHERLLNDTIMTVERDVKRQSLRDRFMSAAMADPELKKRLETLAGGVPALTNNKE